MYRGSYLVIEDNGLAFMHNSLTISREFQVLYFREISNLLFQHLGIKNIKESRTTEDGDDRLLNPDTDQRWR